MNAPSHRTSAPKSWSLHEEITEPSTGLVARITKNDGKFPGFSVEIGIPYREGSGREGLSRHFPVRWVAKNGKVTLQHDLAAALHELGELVADSVHKASQEAEDTRIEEMQTREKKDMDRGKQAQSAGLKKLSK